METETHIDFSNQALLQDEILLTISLVLEHNWPIGPSFIHAMNTLIEAVVIHDKVYFDPLQELRRAELPSNTVPGILKHSDFVQLLIHEAAIEPLPDHSVLDADLAFKGRDYRLRNFFAGAYWSLESFAYGGPEKEAERLELYLDLVRKAQPLLRPREMVPHRFRTELDGEEQIVVGGEAVSRFLLGKILSLTDEDLRILEGLNFRAKAHFDLARNLGLTFHPFYLALPHHLGAIRQNNSVAVRLYQELLTQFSTLSEEESIGHNGFGRTPVPALAEIVLHRCKDSAGALALELLNLRQEHRQFREYLTAYERAWNSATSKQERWRLRSEFDKAVKALIDKEKRPSTRLIYTLWDMLKSPSKILQEIGDKLVAKGQEEYIIGRVKGLHDFWKDLADSPTSDVMRRHFNRLFPKQADEYTWKLGQRLATALETELASEERKG